MKKFVTALLMVSMAVPVVGCGNTSSDSTAVTEKSGSVASEKVNGDVPTIRETLI